MNAPATKNSQLKFWLLRLLAELEIREIESASLDDHIYETSLEITWKLR